MNRDKLHAGATVQGASRPHPTGPHGLPVGTFWLVEVDDATGQPVSMRNAREA